MRTLLFVLAVTTSGCATLVRGNTASVAVDAGQDSAYVFVDSVPAGIAPTVLEVSRSQSHRLEVMQIGYKPAYAQLEHRISPGAVIGSLLLGSLTGLAVDVQSGALYNLEPGVVTVTLIPDSTGAQADYVASRVRQAQRAALTGFAEANPNRRSPAPWLTIQSASGAYVGAASLQDNERTGGVGVALAVGVRDEQYSARISGIVSTGFLFDNSERWEIAGLVGVQTEAGNGRIRLGVALGPGIAGGRKSNACLFCGPRSPSSRERLPVRVGLSALAEGYAFITPQIGLGLQVPARFRLDDLAAGVMFGLKYEGL